MEAFKRMKKAIIAITCILLAGGAAVGGYFLLGNRSGAEETVSAYREYRAASGSISVGVTETGTVSLEREYVTLPVEAKVSEINVSVGTSVSEGDLLLKLDPEKLSKSAESYLLSMENARLAYETAVAQRDGKAAEAKKIYNETILKQENADGDYSLSVKQLDSELTTAQKKLSELEKNLAEYEAMKLAYPDDYEKLTALSDKKDALTEELSTIKKEQSKYASDTSDELSEYNTLKTAYEKAQTTYDDLKESYDKMSFDSSQTDDEGTDYEAYKAEREAALEKLNAASEAIWTAKNKYLSKAERGSAINQKLDEYTERTETLEEQLDKATEEYSDFEEYYRDLYTVEGDDIDKKIESTKEEIAAAELSAEKLNGSYSSNLLVAEYDRDSAKLSASSAQAEYDSAVQKLDFEIAELKTKYEDMSESYDDIMEIIGDEGCIYSEVNGTVSAVSAEEDSDVQANYTLITIMDSSAVTLSASVSEEDVTALSVGQAASVVLSSYSGMTIDGSVSEISVEPARSSASVSYTVTVALDSETAGKLTIYEGMTGEITFISKSVSEVLYVNKQAVGFENGESYVLVADSNGNAVRKTVITGFSDGSYVEIKDGLSAGDTVLTESAVSSR